MRTFSRFCLIFIFTLLFSVSVFADAEQAKRAVSDYINSVAAEDIAPGYANGEWFILAAARSDIELKDSIFDGYYAKLCNTLKQNGGILSERKYTEYSRTIIALTAIDKDPRDVGGYNLLEKLADLDAVKKQGVNGSIYALIALDCGNYTIPQTQNGTQATRALYIEHILSAQKADGGFALSGESGDADVTAMALQALAKYRDDEKVNTAVEKALAWLSENQLDDGGFATVGDATCESSAQVLTALCALGIDPDTDESFIKNGHTICDNILSYKTSGGFKHLKNAENADIIASEQAVYSLVAYIRANEGKTTLYSIKDEKSDISAAIMSWTEAFKTWQAANEA
ncbi:MAG: terpene cyclase/mutase family protein [Firmicutes bacterium]|nr:terpene cyclase/mutase family protein [Bacillota bacterium]